MQNTPQKPDAADAAIAEIDTAPSEQKRAANQQTVSAENGRMFAATSHNADDKWGCDDDIEDEVIGGGCVNAAVAGASERGATGTNDSINDNSSGQGHSTGSIHRAEHNGTLSADSYAASASGELVEDIQTPISTAALIPPLLKDPTAIGDAFLAASGTRSISLLDSSLAADHRPELDDGRPVTQPEDYDHVAHGAYSHWRSRLKQPSEALEQSVTDIRDFILGSSRRRLQLVLIQLYDLIEKTPRIYELLEYKQNIESSNSTQAWLERKLNSIWAELKTKCSLLILDKESTAWSTLDQVVIPETDMCRDKVLFVQSLVLSTIQKVVENCSVLWDCFDDSVRGLVLVNSGEDIIRSMFLATDNSHGLRRGLLRSLLRSFSVLPDLYKAVIRGTVKAAAATSTSSFRLVVSELQMYRVLPGVLFGAIASYARTTLSVDETIQQLDSIFGACNSSLWIGTPAGRTRSKYAQSGTELYGIVCSYFFAQSADDDKQRQALQFMRVVSGLIGHLRLDVKETFLDAFKRTERFVLDSNTADMSASLLLVLVGFGSQVTAHGILNAISGVENHLVAARIDSIIAHLLTDHIKPVVEFVNSVLGMDFVYPRERLFYFKDIVTQSKSAYFSGAAIARRLLSRDYYKPSDSLCCSQFQRAAILYFLQAEIFQENGIDVREWFSALIWNMDAATANEFGVAIKAYVSAVFSSSAITPIPETAIWKAFSPEAVFNISSVDSVSPAQVLYLLYLLYYCENLSDQSKGPGSQFLTLGKRPLIGHASTASSQPRASTLGASLGISINHSTNNFSSQSPHTASTGGSSPPIGMFGAVRRGEYSDQLLDSLPVSWILRCVNRSPEYQLLWPELLSMATAQFPDQLDVVAVLQHELSADSVQQSTPYMSSDSEPRIEAFSEMISDARSLARCAITDISNTCVRNTQLFPLLSTIEQYFKYPAAVRMETCSAFSGYLCRVALQNHANDEIVASICQAWFSLHELNPHIVSTATANSWRTKEETTKPKLIPQDVWLDPLVLFRSDSRIFESPGLTDILLTVLAEFLVLSRTSIRRIHSLRQRDNSALKMSHVVAMVQLQESSALQILIELASFSQNDAVRALIFEFIHARFLEQRVVQKLVHFQAYELTAIDDMVKHVPSMHACSEFIPEMLMQSLPRLQLFSIRLAASITSNYPIVANEGMTKEVILPHIQTTLTQVSGTVAEEQLAISNAMFEAVIRINNVFPLIRQDCMRLVNAVRTAAIEKAQTALQDNQQQHGLIQNIAKWVGSCDKVLEIIGSENPEAARPQYTQIEDISADEFVSVVESTVKLREKSKHVGHKPTLATNSIDLGGSQQPGAMTSQTPGMLPTPSPNQAMPQPHGAGSATLGNAKRSHSAAMSSDADHSSRMVPLSTGKRETGGSVEFGRGRSTFVNPGASRGSPAAGPLSDLAGHGNAAAMYTHSLPASSAQMSVSSGPGTSAGFKKRSRHRSRPPPGGKEINGTKTPAIGIKRAKVPGGERQQRSKDP